MEKREKEERRKKRHLRVRKKLFGTEERPRICLYKSQKHIYGILVDDKEGKVIITISSNSPYFKKDNLKGYNIEGAKKVGEILGEKLEEMKVKEIIFDRSGYPYHGRVKFLAEEIRKKGINF